MVHEFVYAANGANAAGQLTSDKVTTLPGGVDATVKRIERAYDTRRRATTVTSYDATTSGNIVNQVAFTYNDSTGGWNSLSKFQQNNTGAVDSNSPAVEFAYDDGNDSGAAKYLRLTSVTYPGPSTRRVVYYNYPGAGDGAVLNRLQDIADDTSANSGRTKYAVYSYLGSGTIFKVEHPGATNGLTLDYDTSGGGGHSYAGLDQFGRVVDQAWKVNGSAVDRYSYGYDGSGGGNRFYRKNEQSTTRSEFYAYDGLNRLTESKRGTLHLDGYGIPDGITAPDQEQAFTLDKLGNWTNFLTKTSGTTDLDQTRYHNTVNEIAGNSGNPITETTSNPVSPVWIDPVYDAPGSGNMTEDPSALADPTVKHKFAYDSWNRLAQVNDASDDPIAVYRYDGLNHRIRKFVRTGTNEWTVNDYFYNNAWQVLEERKTVEVSWDGTGSGPDVATGVYCQYVWDQRYIDAPVCRFRDTDADGVPDDETLYYCNDANMNVTALVNTGGEVVERYVYDPYGKVAMFDGSWNVLSASAYANEILYCGYRYDPETGLDQVRNRMYQPMVAAWMSRDPVGYVDGEVLYAYAAANPVQRRDPSGLVCISTTAGCDAEWPGKSPLSAHARCVCYCCIDLGGHVSDYYLTLYQCYWSSNWHHYKDPLYLVCITACLSTLAVPGL